MRTGVCTTDFEHAGAALLTADALFAKIRDLGFSCVQFAFSSVRESAFVPDGELEIPAEILPGTVSAAGESAAKYDLPICVINGTFNMAHPDIAVRKEGLRRIELLFAAARELGVPYVSLCSGTRNRAHLWRFSDENDTPEAWDDMLDTVKRTVELAERYGVTAAVESEASNIIDTPENARRLMDTVGSEHLKMILDCANLFGAGHAHPDEVLPTLQHAFDVFGHDIVIAHGKDIREGDGIAFCGTGRGIVDFAFTASKLREYNFSGDMFLHGIYDETDMPRALAYWQNAEKQGTFIHNI